jgi:DNA-binding transcriptional LysR family regulator
MESDNPETTREFVRAGLGISLVPQMTWFEALRDVAALPVAFPACYRYLNLSWKTDSKLSLSAVLLREYIVDHFWEFVRSTSNSTYPME